MSDFRKGVIGGMNEEKRKIDLDYVSGESEDFYEIEVDGEILQINKPKSPIAELLEQGKKLPDKPIKEIKKDIRTKMKKEVEEE